jgi:hypothetical protein
MQKMPPINFNLIPARESSLHPRYTRIARFMEHQELEIDSLCHEFLNQPAPSDSLGFVYHYTNKNAALSILANEELWASEINHLEDKKELIFATEILHDFIEREARRDAPQNPKKNRYDSTAWLLATFMKDGNQWTKPEKINNIFIASFSNDSNNSFQWKNYADNKKGVCLAFQKSTLQRSPSIYGGLTKSGNVLYGEKSILNFINLAFDSSIRFVIKYSENRFFEMDTIVEWATQKFFENFLSSIQFFKSFKYEYEDEWRKSIHLYNNWPAVKTRDKDIKYVEFSCKSNLKTEKMTHYLPIFAIICGEKMEKEEIKHISDIIANDPHLSYVRVCSKEEWNELLASNSQLQEVESDSTA